MARTFEQSREWSARGTSLFLGAVAGMDETSYPVGSALPGWSRKHVVAHVAANADALGNLVHWAETGVETPMYSSPEERAAGIERDAAMPVEELTAWARDSAERLDSAMSRLTPEHWQREVVTAQGRTVPATELQWMRAREVCVHAVDLGTGVGFADLPDGFLTALTEEIRLKRGLTGLQDGPVHELTAWLAGRPHSLAGAPELGPWL